MTIMIEYSPTERITGIQRVTLRLLREILRHEDVILLVGLGFFRPIQIPKNIQVKFLPKGSLLPDFDDELLIQISKIKPRKQSYTSLKGNKVIYPFWRPGDRWFDYEIGIYHDSSPIDRPDDFNHDTVERFNQHISNSAALNDLTIFVSKFSMNRALEYAGFVNENSIVMYPGPSFSSEMIFSAGLKKKNGAELKKLIYVGSIDPRKGVLNLLDWFRFTRFRDQFSEFVIVGGHVNRSLDNNIQKEFYGRLNLDAKTVYLGSLSDRLLFDVYAGADMLIYPSEYEGFGIPVCDSLMFGLSTVTSNITSMVEFEEFGAQVISPLSPWDWDSCIDLDKTFDIKKIDNLFNYSNWMESIGITRRT